MCISARGRGPGRESDGRLQALGGCKWTGQCMSVRACVSGRGSDSNESEIGWEGVLRLPSWAITCQQLHPLPAGMQALDHQGASRTAPNLVTENSQLHSLANMLALGQGSPPARVAILSLNTHTHSHTHSKPVLRGGVESSFRGSWFLTPLLCRALVLCIFISLSHFPGQLSH